MDAAIAATPNVKPYINIRGFKGGKIARIGQKNRLKLWRHRASLITATECF